MKQVKLILSVLILFTVVISAVSAESIRTELEKSNYGKLTTHSEMMKYLVKLDSKSRNVTMKIIGHSVQGREIPAIFFSLDKKFGSKRAVKPVVLIYCQQHGNEPSGKEGVLIFSRSLLAKNKYLLNNMDIIIVPMVNPDGGDAGKRRNANNKDLNRNHVILSEPESYAVHQLFLKWMPEVTLDIHEYNAILKSWIEKGFIKDADEMLGGVTNLNIDKKIRDLSSYIIPEVGDRIKQKGFIFHEYVVGAPFKNMRLRTSTTNINDGRQSMGIYNTLSFIIEGKRYGDLTTEIKRRTEGQIAAIESFLSVIAENRDNILKTVSTSRKAIINNLFLEKSIALQMDYFTDNNNNTIMFPVFNLYNWHHEIKELNNYTSLVKIKKSVKVPFGYIIPKSETRILDILKKHKIKMLKITENTEVNSQIYKIKHVTEMIEEEKEEKFVDAERDAIIKNVSEGDIFIPVLQRAGNLIVLLLEPESSIGLVSKRSGRDLRFKEYLKEGAEYPIIRVPEKVELRLEPVE